MVVEVEGELGCAAVVLGDDEGLFVGLAGELDEVVIDFGSDWDGACDPPHRNNFDIVAIADADSSGDVRYGRSDSINDRNSPVEA